MTSILVDYNVEQQKNECLFNCICDLLHFIATKQQQQQHCFLSRTCEQLLIDLHPHVAPLLPPLQGVTQNCGSPVVGRRSPAHRHAVLGYVGHLGLGRGAWRFWAGGFKQEKCSQTQDMKKGESTWWRWSFSKTKCLSSLRVSVTQMFSEMVPHLQALQRGPPQSPEARSSPPRSRLWSDTGTPGPPPLYHHWSWWCCCLRPQPWSRTSYLPHAVQSQSCSLACPRCRGGPSISSWRSFPRARGTPLSPEEA